MTPNRMSDALKICLKTLYKTNVEINPIDSMVEGSELDNFDMIMIGENPSRSGIGADIKTDR